MSDPGFVIADQSAESKLQYHYTLNDTPASNQELVRLAARVLIRNRLDITGIAPENMPCESFWDTQGFTLGRKRSVDISA